MKSEESEDDGDDRPQVIVYDDKSEPRRAGSRLARSEDSESNEEEENSDDGIEYLEVRQKSGRKFLDNLRTLYERRVQEALDLADQIR